MKKIPLYLCLLLCSLHQACAEQTTLKTFSLSEVKITAGPFLHAQLNDLQYVMSLDPDRLLAPYRREAGIPSKIESYGNWENTGLDGHIGGHYLSALAMLYADTDNKEVYQRLMYMITELKKCQDKNGDGYLGGVPGSKALWNDIAAGKINTENFALNNHWVPWYNLHKVYAGLRDAYIHAGIKEARDILVKLADWSMGLTSHLTDEQMQTMLRAEHGGMNEVLADVAAITGDEKYLQLARRFSHREILDPLLKNEDRLTNLHANTQIPKVIGYKRIADLANDQSWNEAAGFFWDTVVNNRTVAIGGNSVREHFNAIDNFEPMITEVEGPETCNTYNMLRLTKMLFLSNGSEKYINFYENAQYNHILSTQHPENGGLVYFTPMRPQHYRVYSQSQKAMWCCVGSGIENHAKYATLIYAHNSDDLYVNLFVPSQLHWKEKNITLSQHTNFPDSDTSKITVDSDGRFTLKLRYPQWVKKGLLQLTINDKPVKVNSAPGEYISIRRSWKQGDSILLKMPMHINLQQMPDKSDYYAMRYGPIVLAAKTNPFKNEKLNFLSDDSRMGHIPQGELCPLDESPVLVGNLEDVKKSIKRSPGEMLSFTIQSGVDTPQHKTLQLVPFYSVHDSRYVVYWPAMKKDELKEFRATSAKAEQARLALEAITIDQVAPGEQQPESDHFFKGEQTESGANMLRHWRHAFNWFSYKLNDKSKEAKYLQITYFGADRGRNFDIFINDIKIASVALKGEHGAEFYSVDYPIPSAVAKNSDGHLVTKFVAHKDSIAGGIYYVRLLRAKEKAGTE
ncbi:MAG: glycoside hydrolase family 127 protein [Gammaproteobacteria bacterium]|nr:glycoside hydrolase family 127 protein [Gammaproteobacteria bacterium]